jgi:hypothetical protein
MSRSYSSGSSGRRWGTSNVGMPEADAAAAALVAVAEAALVWREARFEMVAHANDNLVAALDRLDAARAAK